MAQLSMRAEDVQNAITRYQQRTPFRERARSLLKQGKIFEANENERVAQRLTHLRESFLPAGRPGQAVAALAQERIIGASDLLDVSFLTRGVHVADSIGRIVQGHGNSSSPIGTGFLVSPSLLMTNNHVIRSREEAGSYRFQMRYQRDDNGQIGTPIEFKLDPDRLFVTHVDLDFTIVAVEPQASDGTPLEPMGFIPLMYRRGKILVGEYASIIQHPNGEPKQLALRENRVVDILDDYLHYETDTSPGTSGSPVFNDQWELIALHHSGVPALDHDHSYLAIDGRRWEPDMGEDNIKWIANEGVRITRIVETIARLGLGGTQGNLLRETLSVEGARQMMQRKNERVVHLGRNVSNRTMSFTIPVTISIDIGEVMGSGHPGVLPRIGEVEGERRTRPVQDYSDREGYDPQFLGRRVDLPGLGRWSDDAAQLEDGSTELKYTHYSAVMSSSRQLALFTVVNIDGEQSQHLKRSDRHWEAADRWSLDPRIDARYQITENELYDRNDLDLGHLVRREDPVWGDLNTARKANDDTFHFTNCSPQHKNLNQRTWLELENYILKNARDNGLKVSVFTGPVLSQDDPEFRGIQIPEEFWKVVALKSGTNGLSVTAYLQSQKNLLGTLEGFRYGQLNTYQVPLATIEQKTGLDFSQLRHFENTPPGGFQESTRRVSGVNKARLITSTADVRL